MLQNNPKRANLINMGDVSNQREGNDQINVKIDKNGVLTPKESHIENRLTKFQKLTKDQRQSLRQKTTQLNIDSFSEIEYEYDQCNHQLSSWYLQLESLRYQAETQEILELLEEMENSIDKVKIRRNKLEIQLYKIAENKSDIYKKLKMPKRYGSNSGGKNLGEQIKHYHEFSPKDPDSRFSAVWNSLVQAGENPDALDLNEEGYKNALLIKLKGEALDYFLTYMNKPLDELIHILGNRFEKYPQRAEWIKHIKTFKKEPTETITQSLERLKFYIHKATLNKSDEEKRFLENTTILTKLKGVVSEEVWKKLMEDKMKAEEQGKYFQLLDSLIVAQHANDMEYQNDDFNIGLNTIDLNDSPCQHDDSKHQNQNLSKDINLEAYNIIIENNKQIKQNEEIIFPDYTIFHDEIQLGEIDDLY